VIGSSPRSRDSELDSSFMRRMPIASAGPIGSAPSAAIFQPKLRVSSLTTLECAR